MNSGINPPVEMKVEVSGTAGNITQTVIIGPKPIGLVAPPLNSTWVERQPYQEIKTALLNCSEGSHACVVSAVHGMGGIGKTWLARALANDSDIRERMGVLWITVGQESVGSEAMMRDMIALLAPSHPRNETRDGIQAALRGLLAERPRLLVLDDVWDENIAADFVSLFASNSPSRLLITTRKGWMTESVGANSFRLNIMSEKESLALFERNLGRALQTEEFIPASQLTEMVEYLPLALSLIIARIKQGQKWEDLLSKLKFNINSLNQSKPRRPGQAVEPSLQAVFNTSLNPMRDAPEWRVYWESFIRMSVLAEDTHITPKLARRLLGETGQEILELLADEALLTRNQSNGNVYQMHDLLKEHARQLLERSPSEGLGITLVQAETELLARYGFNCDEPKSFQAAWQLEEDGYIHPRLVYHLARLNQMGCIETVLNAETFEGKNGWFQKREALGQTGGFVVDVEQWRALLRASNLASLGKNLLPDYLEQEVRCVLLLSTIHSLAANIPPILLQQLINFRIWRPEQALTYLRQIGNDNSKVAVIIAIAPNLPPVLLQEALEVAQSIRDEKGRSAALAAIAPNLPQEQQILVVQQSLEAAQSIHSEWDRSWALAVIAPNLPPEQQAHVLLQALVGAQGIQSEWFRALAVIAPNLPPEQQTLVLQQALEVAQSISYEKGRSAALAALAPNLPSEQQTLVLQQALEVAQSIRDEKDRSIALSTIAPNLPPEQQALVLQQALEVARSIQGLRNKKDLSAALAAIAPKLPQEQQALVLQQALVAAQDIWAEVARSEALAAIAPHLPIKQALEVAQSIANEKDRSEALAAIAPKLPPVLLQQALAVEQRIQSNWSHSAALTAIAPNLPPEQRTQVLRQAMEVAQGIRDEEALSAALGVIAPNLPPEQQTQVLQQAMEVAQSIHNEWHRARALAVIAPNLPPEQQVQVLQQALAAAQSVLHVVQSEWHRALAAIVPKLPLVFLLQALEVVQSIQDQKGRSEALATIAPTLPPEQQAQVLQQALEVAQNIPNEKDRCVALAAIAPKLPPEQQAQVLLQTLAVAQGMRHSTVYDEENRSEALAAIAPILPPKQALEVAQSIANEKDRSVALAAIAPKLRPEQQTQVLQQALEVAQSISYEKDRSEALAAIAPHLPIKQALEVAQSIRGDGYEQYSSAALVAIADQVCVHHVSLCLYVLDVVALEQRDVALSVISRLSSALGEIGGARTVDGTILAIKDVCQWWP